MCPTFAPERDIIVIILEGKQIWPLPQRDTLSLPLKAVARQTYLKIYFRTETASVSAQKI